MNTTGIPIYTVSQVNGYVKSLMDGDDLLTGLLVRGEISNYKRYPSGHHYFSLKDEQGSLRCVMFRGEAARLRFRPENGMRVVAFGRVSVFPRDGAYQLYCSELMQDGRGALDEAFERLRRRLEGEGLFDPANKQPLPRYPKKIALVTSPAGAAVRDMLRVLGARWPMAEVLVVPVRVQGQEAAGEVSTAIHRLNNRADIDLIIAGRGGGSKEDLWAFNEEVVARAIYISNIPVISAVGHEPDVTIADYVADLRAATPSNGAELAVPDQAEEKARLEQLGRRLARVLRVRLDGARRELVRLQDSRALQNIKAPIQDRRMALDDLRRRMSLALRRETGRGRQALDAQGERLPLAMGGRLAAQRGRLGRLSAGLDALSPLKVLGRGYAIARHGEDVVSSIAAARPGDPLDVLVSDGVLRCEVKEKEERVWQEKNSPSRSL